MTLEFTPPAPWVDEQVVEDQFGNEYAYDEACETLRPVAGAAAAYVACPSASVEAGNAPTAAPTAPVTPPSEAGIGQMHFESYANARNTFCFDGFDWNFIDQFFFGGTSSLAAPPCATGSTESGNAPTSSPSAPVTPPGGPVEGQVHYEIYDDALNIFCYDGASWDFTVQAVLGANGGVVISAGANGGGSTPGPGLGIWTTGGVGGGTTTNVPIVARRIDGTWGLFTLTLNDEAGDPS